MLLRTFSKCFHEQLSFEFIVIQRNYPDENRAQKKNGTQNHNDMVKPPKMEAVTKYEFLCCNDFCCSFANEIGERGLKLNMVFIAILNWKL